MYPYIITIIANNQSVSFEVRGAEAAYDRYRALSFGVALYGEVNLVDGLTGEVIESTSEDWD